MTFPPDSIAVALIGYGYAGKTFHAPLIQAVPGLRLAVVSSSSAEKVRADLPTVTVVADPLVAATHPEVQLVVIASPNDSHAPLATAALHAGKHVVVDKPFTLTLAEARELAALAAAQNRVLSVFQNRRWDGDFMALQAVLRERRLGEVVHFESHFDRFRPEVLARWREQDVLGAGIWFDLGPHIVDQALQLFGLPQTVSASLVRQRPGAAAVDWAHVILSYGRKQVVLHAGMLVAGAGPRFAVHGTVGSWIKHGLDTQENQLRAHSQSGASGSGADSQSATLHVGATGERLQLPVPPGDYTEYYRQIHAAIVRQSPNPVPPVQAVAVMAVLETAIESAATRRTLPLPLTEAERGQYLAGNIQLNPC